jgi:MtN3 and saliva related transmembrane protein
MDYVDILATIVTIVGSITSFSLFFQAAKIWKNKCAEDISLIAFSMVAINVTLWVIYGLVLKNLPLIITNSIVVVASYLVIALTLKFKKRKHK